MNFQPVNALAAIGAGQQLAQNQINFGRQNALSALMQREGGNILAGDRNALAQYAQFDPQGAIGIQASQQSMAFDRERMQMARDEAARAAQQAIEAGQAEALAASMAEAERELRTLAPLFEAGDPERFNQIAQSRGIDVTFDSYMMEAAQFEGVMETLQTLQDMNAAPEPADEYGRYVAEERAAGREPLSRIDYAQAKRGNEVIYGPDGRPIVARGPNAGNIDLTESESKTNIYLSRAENALQGLDAAQEGGALLSDSLTERGNAILQGVPLGIGREVQGADYQTALAYGDAFLQAILRKDTGAAITEQEQVLYGRTYLPQPGDGPEVLAVKRELRVNAVEAIRAGMSPDQQVLADQAVLNTATRLAETSNQGSGPARGGQQQADLSQPTPRYIQEGHDPGLWEFMPEEDRALFQ